MEEASPNYSINLDNRNIDAMIFDDHNSEDFGKEDGLEVYDKVWGGFILSDIH